MSVLRWDEYRPSLIKEEVRKEFFEHRPVAIPTDTLYGLAGPVGDHVCLAEIFRLKRRPLNMTLPIAVSAFSMIGDLAVVCDWQEKIMKRALPGPVTFVLEAKDGLNKLVVKNDTVAVRVPRHPVFLPLCEEHGPIALTSANLHGSVDLLTAAEIDRQFGGELLVIEDDASIAGIPTTIVDLRNETASILREGNLNMEEVMGGQDGRR